jgi:cardiolipin synthase
MGAVALAASCATVPDLDREILARPREPVQVRGAHGVLSREASTRLLEDLARRSPDTSVLDRHAAIEQALAGTPLSLGNKATLLQDGRATYGAMLSAIHAARSSIHLEMYIFEAGDIGREFAAALAERRRAGVQVRVLYDSVGSKDTPKEFFDGLRGQGIEVSEYNPVSGAKLLEKGLELQHRDHRKLMVVDGRIAFLGGVNISKTYGPAPRGPGGSTPSGPSGASVPSGGGASGGARGEGAKAGDPDPPFEDRPWRDTQLRLEGPVVAQLQRLFLEQWARQRKEEPLAGAAYFPKLAPAGSEVVRAIAGSPDDGVDALYVALISAIENAEMRVRITNAYFVPAKELREALENAARRGVDVRLVLPSRSDSWLVTQAARSYYDELLASGVKIYEREGRILHAKTASIDGVWSTVGSTNLDWISLLHNDELNAVVLGPDFAAAMERAFDDDVSHSSEVTLARWRDRSLVDRAKEAAARAWARLL